MERLLSGYYKGDIRTGVYYTLFSAKTFDGKSFFGVLRDYGEDLDGLPRQSVSLVCEDDGTVESYSKAYDMFRRFID